MGPLGSSGESRAEASPPTPQLEGFTALRYLGTGPSGQTWHAQSRSGRQVALKILSSRVTSQSGFLTRFEKETAPLLGLRHAHIVELVARGRSDIHFYLATEYMAGGSLRERRREPMEPKTALRVAHEVATALHYAHVRGLLHRGLKPENLFLTSAGIKVADFGLARLRDDEMLNPSRYIAPEQRQRPAYADGRADLYALATLLYELLFVEPPPRPWSPVASRVPVRDSGLFSLFSQSLAEDPDQRFRRVRDFADELERLHARSEEAARPSTPAAGGEAGSLSIEVKGRTAHVKVRTRGDAEWLQRSLITLEHLLRQPGPWAVAYDLSAVDGWNTREVEVITELHRRHTRNLRCTAFYSPVPAVRGGGVLVGTSLKEIPWKTFASLQAMREWVERGPQ